MSRIGRLPIAIPAGVTVEIAENNKVTVKGPKGTLVRELPVEMKIEKDGDSVVVSRPNELKKMKSLHGLTRTSVSYTHLKEQLIFPEIEYDKVDKVRGMDVIFVTTAHTDEEARELLRLFGMPFKK